MSTPQEELDFETLDKQMRDADLEPEPAEEATQEPTPEPVPEPVAPTPEPKHDDVVPLPRLRAEAERRRAAEAENNELKRRLAAIAAVQQEAESKPRLPEFNEDPLGNLQARTQNAEAQIQAYQQQVAQQQAVQRMLAEYRNAARTFASEQKDFPNAYAHLLEGRQDELRDMGFTPEQVEAQIEAEERALVYQAFQRGRNPAEDIYTLAKRRGYSGPKPAPAPAQEPEKVLETLEAGKKAEVKGGAGSGGSDDIVKRLADPNLTPKEFDELFEQAKKKGLLG